MEPDPHARVAVLPVQGAVRAADGQLALKARPALVVTHGKQGPLHQAGGADPAVGRATQATQG